MSLLFFAKVLCKNGVFIYWGSVGQTSHWVREWVCTSVSEWLTYRPPVSESVTGRSTLTSKEIIS